MIDITRADFDEPALATFLNDHLADMKPTAPPESRHALDISALQEEHVRLWVAHVDGSLVGTVATATVAPGHDELKSMRTAPERRRSGIGSQLIAHVLEDARLRGATRLSLETGSAPFFAGARAMYSRAGFVVTGPFGTYSADPESVFMTRLVEAVDDGAGSESIPDRYSPDALNCQNP